MSSARISVQPTTGRPRVPLTVVRDPDLDDVVALRIERAQHGARRKQRDLMLAGPPAENDADPQALAHTDGGLGLWVVGAKHASPPRGGAPWVGKRGAR